MYGSQPKSKSKSVRLEVMQYNQIISIALLKSAALKLRQRKQESLELFQQLERWEVHV